MRRGSFVGGKVRGGGGGRIPREFFPVRRARSGGATGEKEGPLYFRGLLLRPGTSGGEEAGFLDGAEVAAVGGEQIDQEFSAVRMRLLGRAAGAIVRLDHVAVLLVPQGHLGGEGVRLSADAALGHAAEAALALLAEA